MQKLITKANRTILKNDLLKTGETVVVGVSGGPDSVALLHALTELRHSWGISLHIAHFNHRLRKSADGDERFVRQMAERLSLPFSVNKKGPLKFKENRSLEEQARLARFEFLVKTARKHKAAAIALGHNQDDQAETVLLRILRGTGLSGLRAILPIRNIYGTPFIRPLIEVSRREILEYLRSNRLKFRVDPTNKNFLFLRNRIRHDLLPLLQKNYNPNIKEVLAHLSNVLALDYQLIEEQAAQTFKKILASERPGQSIELKMPELAKQHPSLRRAIIRLAIERIKGDTRRITFSHMLEIEDLLLHRPVSAHVELPAGIRIKKNIRRLTISASAHA